MRHDRRTPPWNTRTIPRVIVGREKLALGAIIADPRPGPLVRIYLFDRSVKTRSIRSSMTRVTRNARKFHTRRTVTGRKTKGRNDTDEREKVKIKTNAAQLNGKIYGRYVVFTLSGCAVVTWRWHPATRTDDQTSSTSFTGRTRRETIKSIIMEYVWIWRLCSFEPRILFRSNDFHWSTKW